MEVRHSSHSKIHARDYVIQDVVERRWFNSQLYALDAYWFKLDTKNKQNDRKLKLTKISWKLLNKYHVTNKWKTIAWWRHCCRHRHRHRYRRFHFIPYLRVNVRETEREGVRETERKGYTFHIVDILDISFAVETFRSMKS